MSFQSSPDPKAGRNGPRRASCAAPGRGSNPRPTRRPGATGTVQKVAETTREFQSSPDPKAGRNIGPRTLGPIAFLFQSSPDPKAGRNRGPAGGEGRGLHVPILARPEGRAQRVVDACDLGGLVVPILARPEGRAQHELEMVSKFGHAGSNPRPTRRPGATGRSTCHPLVSAVPILARPEGRAQPPEGGPMEGRAMSSNPRPTRRPGATLGPEPLSPRTFAFQSSPDPKAGRNTAGLFSVCGQYIVPILARPEGRAQPSGE